MRWRRLLSNVPRGRGCRQLRRDISGMARLAFSHLEHKPQKRTKRPSHKSTDATQEHKPVAGHTHLQCEKSHVTYFCHLLSISDYICHCKGLWQGKMSYSEKWCFLHSASWTFSRSKQHRNLMFPLRNKGHGNMCKVSRYICLHVWKCTCVYTHRFPLCILTEHMQTLCGWAKNWHYTFKIFLKFKYWKQMQFASATGSLHKGQKSKWDLMANACNSRTWEAGVGGGPWVQKASLG